MFLRPVKSRLLAMLGRASTPFPSLAGQTRMAAEVERRLSVAEGESAVSASLHRVTRLRGPFYRKHSRQVFNASMPYPIEKKLVIAVSGSAVFDMVAADQIFRTEGEDAYRKYQLEHVNKPFNKGVAFPFVKRLLGLNEIYSKEQPVEVIVLSRNDPDRLETLRDTHVRIFGQYGFAV